MQVQNEHEITCILKMQVIPKKYTIGQLANA